MKKYAAAIFYILITSQAYSQANLNFDNYFIPKTLRMDYYHTGTKTENLYSLDLFKEEPFWAGSRKNLVDDTNLGKYMVKVIDVKTNIVIYSRGYCSLFGEWQTTDEAVNNFRRTFHESVLVPYPKSTAQIVICERDRQNIFHEMFSVVVKPGSRFIVRDRRYTELNIMTVLESGDPSEKVDILFLGDGYAKNDLEKYRKDVKRFSDELFTYMPYKESRGKFNIRAVEVISGESGIDEPRNGKFRNTMINSSFNAFDLPRYALTFSNRTIRDIAGNAPYDQIVILANSPRYGGGGIFNLYSVTTTDNEYSSYVFIHEFGHAFGGLGDEYYSSNVAYNEFYPAGVEPWEPNITALLDKENVKWKSFISPDTPIPTPADLELYSGIVGCFEGAGYAAKGLFRPFIDCRMNSRAAEVFCPVCQSGIQRMIDFYSR